MLEVNHEVNENCLRIEPLLAAYALNALEIDENRLVEDHIESCVLCRQVVSDYQAISNELMFAQPPSQPPARIRAKLLAQTATRPKRIGILERLRSNPSRLILVSTLVVALILVVINLN